MAYFKRVAEEYDLLKYVRLKRQIVGAAWDDRKQEWTIQVENVDTGERIEDRCHVLINASGVLKSVPVLTAVDVTNIINFFSKWKWPTIPGREKFKGMMLHSANWVTSADLTGKRVAVIGGGSSGVQIVPNIQPSKIPVLMNGQDCQLIITISRDLSEVLRP